VISGELKEILPDDTGENAAGLAPSNVSGAVRSTVQLTVVGALILCQFPALSFAMT